MARGIGSLQERLLAALADGRLYTSLTLAVMVYGIEPNADGLRVVSHTQEVAVRRALNGLMKRKRVWWERRPDHTLQKLWGIADPEVRAPKPISIRALAKVLNVSPSTVWRAMSNSN
jgi:hypothetical protein